MKNKISIVIFFIAITLFYFIIIYKPNYGVIDDHTFTQTILVNKPLNMFIMPEIGRFYPALGLDFNLLRRVSTSPFFLYFYVGALFLIFNFLFIKTLRLIQSELNINNYFIFLLPVFLLLVPSYVTAWLRLFMCERYMLIFGSLFLYTYISYFLDNDKKIFLLISLCSFIIFLFYKEPSFLLLGTFSFFNLINKLLNKTDKRLIKIDSIFLIVSILYFCFYYFFIYAKISNASYGRQNEHIIINYARNFIGYFLSDPILIIAVPLLSVKRFREILKEKRATIFDSMLFSSLSYVIFYLIIGIRFCFHYLAPAYIFALPSLVYFIKKDLSLNKYFAAITLTFALIIQIFISAPISFHLMSFYKNVPNNFQQTLFFLRDYLSEASQNENKRINLFLPGANKNTQVEAYLSFIEWLNFYGINEKHYNLCTDQFDNRVWNLGERPEPYNKHSVFAKNDPDTIKKGDIFIIQPYSTRNDKYISDLTRSSKIIYKTKSIFPEIPNLSIEIIKTAGKFILPAYIYENLEKNLLNRDEMNFSVWRKEI